MEENELEFYCQILAESGEKAFNEVIQKRFNPNYTERANDESDEHYRNRIVKSLTNTEPEKPSIDEVSAVEM